MALFGVMALTGCGFQLKGTGPNNAQLQGMTIRLISNQPRAELTRGHAGVSGKRSGIDR